MIPMNCPKCGARGEIPIDRLDTRLHCKRCGVFFYMDGTGHVYLGDPSDKKKKKGTPKVRSEGPIVDVDLNPINWFKAMPQAARMGLGALAAVGLLIGAVSMIARATWKPESVEARSRKFAELFVDMKTDDMRAFATSASGNEFDGWYDTIRPLLGLKEARKSPGDVTLTNAVSYEMSDTAETTIQATLAGASGSNPGDSLKFPVSWRLLDGIWMIDFRSSLSAYKVMMKGLQREQELKKAKAAAGG